MYNNVIINSNIFRDLKPENLILRSKTDETDVCIADFGLADYYNPKGDYMFKRCGTPGYVAPEVLFIYCISFLFLFNVSFIWID